MNTPAKKPREWWICQTPGFDGDAYDSDPATWAEPKAVRPPREKYHVIEHSAYMKAVEALKDAREGLDKFEQDCDPAWASEYLTRLNATLKELGELDEKQNEPKPFQYPCGGCNSDYCRYCSS